MYNVSVKLDGHFRKLKSCLEVVEMSVNISAVQTLDNVHFHQAKCRCKIYVTHFGFRVFRSYFAFCAPIFIFTTCLVSYNTIGIVMMPVPYIVMVPCRQSWYHVDSHGTMQIVMVLCRQSWYHVDSHGTIQSWYHIQS